MFDDKKCYRFVMALFTVIVFLTPVLKQIWASGYTKLVEDVAYLLMIMISIYLLSRRQNQHIAMNFETIILLALVMFYIIAGVYYSGLTVIILQIRELKYLLLLIILLPYKDIDIYKAVWPTLKAIGYMCLPVSIVQRIISKANGDDVTGLMGSGGSGTLTLFLLLIFFTELGMRLKERRSIPGLYFLLLIPTALNETKITIVLVPVLLLSTLAVTRRLNVNIAIASIILCILLILVWGYVYRTTYGYSLQSIISPEYIKSYMYATNWQVDAGRFAKINYAIEMIKEDNLLLGFGLGASYLGATSGARGYILEREFLPNMLGGTRPQLFISLIEMGVVGTILVVVIVAVIISKLAGIKENRLEKLMGLNSAIIVLVSTVYQSIFYTYQIMFVFVLYTYVSLRFLARQSKASQMRGGMA